jgi:uncharacterized protein
MTWTEWFIAPTCNTHPAVYMAVAVLAVMLVAVSKGGFGGGVGALSIPLMLMVVDESGVVLGMWLPVLIACDICTLPHYPRTWRPKALLKLVPGTVVGIVAGFFLLDYLAGSKAYLKMVIGVISLGFVLLKLLRSWFDRHVAERPAWQPSWWAGTSMGVAAGVSTMLAHAAGSIIQMYVLPQKLEKREFVGTCARFFFVFNIFKIPFFLSESEAQLTWAAFRSSLWLFALAPLGVWFGSWLNSKTDPRWFVRLIYIFLGLAGGKLIFDAVLLLAKNAASS